MAEREEIDLFTVEPINPFLASAFLKTHLYSCNALGVRWGGCCAALYTPSIQQNKTAKNQSAAHMGKLLY